jgi:8-oxo-dGTP diphosphatase
MDDVDVLHHKYPNLFAPKHWRAAIGSVDQTCSMCETPPPDHLIGNVNIVPFVGETCLVIRLSNGQWEIPGGTREPGEPFIETVRRELLEEAGARLLTFTLFGAWHCLSTAPEPYRAHLPHPEFYRVAGWGEVEVVVQPLNLAGAEDVEAVECVPVEEAARRFREGGRPDLAELYMLAAELRAASEIEGRV